VRAIALLLLLLLPAAQAAEVRLVSGAYQPGVVHARVGETVTFANGDDMPHTVTSAWDDGKSFSRVLQPGQSVAVVFQQPGVYVVRCVPHSTKSGEGYQGMVATVEVAPAASFPWSAGWLALLYAGLALSLGVVVAWRGRRRRPRPGATPPEAPASER